MRDAQRRGLRALAALFQLRLAKARGPRGERDAYSLRKTRGAPGALPAGDAELALARLLAAQTAGRAAMQRACDRVLHALGGALGTQAHVARAAAKRLAAAAPPEPEPPAAAAAEAAPSATALAAATAVPPPQAPRPQPSRWYIDRGGGRPPAAA